MSPIDVTTVRGWNAELMRANARQIQDRAGDVDALKLKFTEKTELAVVWNDPVYQTAHTTSRELASDMQRVGRSLMKIGELIMEFVVLVEQTQSTIDNLEKLVTQHSQLPLTLQPDGTFYPPLSKFKMGDTVLTPPQGWPGNFTTLYDSYDATVSGAEVKIAQAINALALADKRISADISAASITLLTAASSPTSTYTAASNQDPYVWGLARRALGEQRGVDPNSLSSEDVQAYINSLASVDKAPSAATKLLGQPWDNIERPPEPGSGRWELPENLDAIPMPNGMNEDLNQVTTNVIKFAGTLFSFLPAGRIGGSVYRSTTIRIPGAVANSAASTERVGKINDFLGKLPLTVDMKRDGTYIGYSTLGSISGDLAATDVNPPTPNTSASVLGGPTSSPSTTVDTGGSYSHTGGDTAEQIITPEARASRDADAIRGNSAYSPGQTVTVDTSTGTANDPAYLQALSQNLGSRVVAYNGGDVWVDGSGNAYASPNTQDSQGNPAPAWPPTGEVTEYTPR